MMMLPVGRSPHEIREKLDRLYRQIATQNEHLIPRQLDDLMLVLKSVAPVDERTRRAFRVCATATTRKELADIKRLADDIAARIEKPRSSVSKASERLAGRLEALHQPTIAALAATPALETGERFATLEVGFVRMRLPTLLRQQPADRPPIAAALRVLSSAIDQARVGETEDEGAPEHRRDRFIALMLANAFALLTGKEPTLSVIKKRHPLPRRYAGAIARKHGAAGPSGAFLKFVTNAFRDMGVRSAPWTMAKDAVAARKKTRTHKGIPKRFQMPIRARW